MILHFISPKLRHHHFSLLKRGFGATCIFHTSLPSSNRRHLSRILLKNEERIADIVKQSHIKFRLANNSSKRLFGTSSTSWTRKENKSDNEEENDGGIDPPFTLLIIGSLMPLSLALFVSLYKSAENTVSWNEFIEEILPTGEVQKILIRKNFQSHSFIVKLQSNASYNGKKFNNSLLNVINVSDIGIAESLIRNKEKQLGINPLNKVPIGYEQFNLITIGAVLTVISLVLSVLVKLSTSVSVRMYSSNTNAFRNGLSTADKVSTGVKFSDVAGNKEAKQEVFEFVHYLKHPEKYEHLGAKMPRGCLLTGPPGVGKTLLAKAVATEADVPFMFKAGSDFVEMIGGLGAKRVRELFDEARAQEPCIIYIDELDAVGGKRSDSSTQGSSEKDQTLNQILVEMDGMFSADHNVIVIGSTNRADMLDRALLRPGRFDRIIDIDLPTRAERKEIFEQHLKCLKLIKPACSFSGRLASLTPGKTGADIANICNEAAIFAAREKDVHIDSKHFEYAVERILAGAARKNSSTSIAEQKIVAVHEAGHTLVGWLLKHTDAPIKVSIVPRTKSKLGFVRTLQTDRKLYSSKQLFDIMCMTLAGRAAENLVFGTVTQGAEDDLKKVTKMAYTQVKDLGFSPVVGNISFAGKNEAYTKPYSDALATLIDQEANKIIYESHRHAEDILKSNLDKLNLLSQELLKREVLNYSDIVDLLGPPPHGDKTQVFDMDLPIINP